MFYGNYVLQIIFPTINDETVSTVSVWFEQGYLKPWGVYIVLLLKTRSRKNCIGDKV
jgi:hypothetical protein